MDKLWAERDSLGAPSGTPRRDDDRKTNAKRLREFRNWNIDAQAWDSKRYAPDAGMPQARTVLDQQASSNAWSVIWGAMLGAGSVLLIAVILLLWRRPRKRGVPLLAPMDVGRNVSLN